MRSKKRINDLDFIFTDCICINVPYLHYGSYPVELSFHPPVESVDNEEHWREARGEISSPGEAPDGRRRDRQDGTSYRPAGTRGAAGPLGGRIKPKTWDRIRENPVELFPQVERNFLYVSLKHTRCNDFISWVNKIKISTSTAIIDFITASIASLCNKWHYHPALGWQSSSERAPNPAESRTGKSQTLQSQTSPGSCHPT